MKDILITHMILYLSYIFILFCIGCSTQHRSIGQDDQLANDSLIVMISKDELVNLKNVNIGNPLYIGFGNLWYSNIRSSRGVMLFDVRFNKIYFNRTNRELYIEGKLVNLETDAPLEECQIIIGSEPKEYPDIKSSEFGEVKYVRIEYNHIIRRGGYFKARLPVNDYSIMLFTSREIYNDSGQYIGTPTSIIYAFDIYKLLKTTSK